ncbi:MAG TPA: hypothetical protein VMK65_06505, partial [Longimicrobiales bacterium]|nr:hypothetical protein [Longimicrobiales bacterium]
LKEARPPEQHPFYTDMKADRDGRVWLRLPTSTTEATWRVFDGRGRPLYEVSMPSDVEPLDISDHRMLAIERDALGVEFVLVYAFPSALRDVR